MTGLRTQIREAYHRWKSSPNSHSFAVSGANPTQEQSERVERSRKEETEHLDGIISACENLKKELEDGKR